MSGPGDPRLRRGHERGEDVDRRRGDPTPSDLHGPLYRERAEPRDGHEPVPLWLVACCGLLVFWGGWYLSHYSGGWRADVLEERPAARFGASGPAQPEDPLALGEKLYKANCVSCHLQDGSGQPGQVPPLDGSPWVLEAPWRLKRILLDGLHGPIEVLGETYDDNMPAFGDRFSDQWIAGVLTWVRQAWGNDAPPISEESVAATRKAVGDRTRPWTADELLALTQPDHTPPAEGSSEEDAAGEGGDGDAPDDGGDEGDGEGRGAGAEGAPDEAGGEGSGDGGD